MKFIIDENLPPSVAVWLSSAGHDALHVSRLQLTGQPDTALIAAAKLEDRVIVTKDGDFDDRSHEVRVMRVTIGNTPTHILLAWLGTRFAGAIARLEAGDRYVRVE